MIVSFSDPYINVKWPDTVKLASGASWIVRFEKISTPSPEKNPHRSLEFLNIRASLFGVLVYTAQNKIG